MQSDRAGSATSVEKSERSKKGRLGVIAKNDFARCCYRSAPRATDDSAMAVRRAVNTLPSASRRRSGWQRPVVWDSSEIIPLAASRSYLPEDSTAFASVLPGFEFFAHWSPHRWFKAKNLFSAKYVGTEAEHYKVYRIRFSQLDIGVIYKAPNRSVAQA
jgi:hypothetical protein